MIMEFKQAIHYIYFLFSFEYVHIIILIWPKTGIYSMLVLILLNKIIFVHVQISVPKISIPMSEIACVYPHKVSFPFGYAKMVLTEMKI